MNWLKLFTQSGRQSIVREILKEYVTPSKIAELATEAAAQGLTAGAGKIDDDRLAKIANGCEKGANALIHITAAISPDGEGGKTITPGEKALICADIQTAVQSIVTQEALDGIVENAVKFVK